MKLKVAAKIYPEERDYFQQIIEPLLHESRSFVEFVGEVGGREKDEFLGNAYALLFPIDWPEPFGLVMIEALACGTPVIAWRNGSVPEVIDDGVTGFVVDSIEQARAGGRAGRRAEPSRLPPGVRGALRRRPHGPGLPGGLPAAGACRLERRGWSPRMLDDIAFRADVCMASSIRMTRWVHSWRETTATGLVHRKRFHTDSVYDRSRSDRCDRDLRSGVARSRESGLYHILAASSLADERTRVLKHGDTFAVFDHYGDIKPGGLGEEGLYHEGTRYLSCLLLELEGGRPFFLSSTVRDENDQLAVALTNPDLLPRRPGAAAARHAAPRAEEVPLAGGLLPAAAGQEPRPRAR